MDLPKTNRDMKTMDDTKLEALLQYVIAKKAQIMAGKGDVKEWDAWAQRDVKVRCEQIDRRLRS